MILGHSSPAPHNNGHRWGAGGGGGGARGDGGGGGWEEGGQYQDFTYSKERTVSKYKNRRKTRHKQYSRGSTVTTRKSRQADMQMVSSWISISRQPR